MRLPCFVPRAQAGGETSGMGMNRIDLVFQHRPVSPPELDRHVVEPAGCKAAIEMPQSWNDDSCNRDLDVGARLIEDKEIEARALGGAHAGRHLLARVETVELRVEAGLNRRLAGRRQIGMLLQAEWRGAVKARFVP